MATKKVAPIKPSQAASSRKIPDVVIEIFNTLIQENLHDGEANIKQEDVVAALVAKGLNPEEIFKKGWLDVEDIFRKAGWSVEYDKAGFNESYDDNFTFSQKRRRR